MKLGCVLCFYLAQQIAEEFEDTSTGMDTDAHTSAHTQACIVEACVFGAAVPAQTTLQPTHMGT